MKYLLLKRLAGIMGHSHLSIEALELIRDNQSMFSDEVRAEFKEFIVDLALLVGPRDEDSDDAI